MDYNRRNQGYRNNDFQERREFRGRQDNFQRSEASFQGTGGNFQGRQDNFHGRQDNFQRREGDFQGRHGDYQGRRDDFQGSERSSQGRQDSFHGKQLSFHREGSSQGKHKNFQERQDTLQRRERRFQPYEPRTTQTDPRQTDLTRKINDFIDSVKRGDKLGDVVLCLKCDEHPFVSLQNSLKPLNITLNLLRDPATSEFYLSVGNEEFARGDYPSQKEAKIALAWHAIDKLHKCCFAIIRKDYYQEVNDEKLRTPSARDQQEIAAQEAKEIGQTSPNNETNVDVSFSSPLKSKESSIRANTSLLTETTDKGKQIIQDSLAVGSSSLVGSKAFNMMLKMGWRGSGLGSEEQGITESILVNENIDRRGLGHEGKGDITMELRNLLTAYSRSNKLTILAFSKDFTKGEREIIHKFCQTKLRNLKTKSVGRDEDRYLTVTRKITKVEMVAELIKIGCENESYKLVIPDNFKESYDESFGNSESDSLPQFSQ